MIKVKHDDDVSDSAKEVMRTAMNDGDGLEYTQEWLDKAKAV